MRVGPDGDDVTIRLPGALVRLAAEFIPAEARRESVRELAAWLRARMRELAGGGPWSGLTYPGDRPRLVAMLEQQVARGEYPPELWT